LPEGNNGSLAAVTAEPPPAPTTPQDSTLAALGAAPFRLFLPQTPAAPFIFASPHSGRCYPKSFIASSQLNALALRRSEDAFADELFDAVTQLGCPFLVAEFPRAFVDVNRAPNELDPKMFDGPLPQAAEPPSARVAAGFGVIPRIVREGVDIYRGLLDPMEAELRLARFYRPYHAALAELVESTFLHFGCAVVVDCHTMPSIPPVADVVLGDCYGQAAATALLRLAELAFSTAGLRTVRNTPYAGGFTTHHYGRRDHGIHALQIEINRSLYLDEMRIEKTAGFAGVKGRLTGALRTLTGVCPALLRPTRPLAAE